MQHILQDYVISKIKQTLSDKVISQKELADKLKISRQQVSKYLTGRTELTLKMVESICEVTDILPETLFFDFYSRSIADSGISDIVSEPMNNSYVIQKYKSDILLLQKRIKELEKDKNILQRTVDVLDKQYLSKCAELDRLERQISESNR